MAFSVPDLPYAFDALEPYIDAQTMEIHHDKHHGAYVANGNKAIEGTEWADKTAEEILTSPAALGVPAIRNNIGGHYNHSLFWVSLSPDGGGEPSGALADAINSTFGSFSEFQEKANAAGVGDQRRRPRDRLHAKPGHAAHRQQDTVARRRRVGARLLPEVPEPPP